MRKDRASHLDPALVDLFLDLLEREGGDLLAMIDRAERGPRDLHPNGTRAAHR